MITFEQDPDVVRWGLQLFESDPYSNCSYGPNFTLNDDGYYHGQYYKEDPYDAVCENVESDEIIAHTLQEELSHLAVAELSESVLEEDESLQVPALSVGWFDQTVDNCSSGLETVREDEDCAGPSTSCSSPEENSYCDEWSSSLEVTDEYAFDGEVGKTFNQMVPVPHVPRINGEIPSIDEATLDHQRLLNRLQLYNLIESKVQGDGNCQFRALSDQFYRTPEHHEFVREQVVDQLETYSEIYEGYVPMDYADYLEKMSKNGEWGDHVTLQAAADSYGVKIFVITSFKDTCYIEILPKVLKSERVIFLSFWAEVHYNSIYPEGDVISFEYKRKKKKWRAYRNRQLESLNRYQSPDVED